MRAFRITILWFMIALVLASCAHCSRCHGHEEGGNWPSPYKTLAVLCDGQEVADQASERIPTVTHLGVVNTRFQLPPGPLDIPIYYWQKWLGLWLRHNAVPMAEKWIPILSKWSSNIQKARNAIILATPIVLKVLHKL